jgi:hypothetical protein
MRSSRLAILAVVLVAVSPFLALAQTTGSLSGTAQGAQNQALSGIKVQLRNVDTGALAGSTTSGANGAFSFTGLNPGNYIIEIVDATGKIIGASASMSVAAGQTISGVTVAAAAAGAVAAAAASGGLGAFFTSTAGILVLAGVGIGVGVGLIASGGNGSPSQ